MGVVLVLGDSDFNSKRELLFLMELHVQRVCKDVEVESHKTIIKQARIQHLYGRFLGTLHKEADEVSLHSFILCICNSFRCVQMFHNVPIAMEHHS